MNQEKPVFLVSLIVIDAIGTVFLAVGLLGLFAPDIATTLLPVMADRNTVWVCIGIGAALILFARPQRSSAICSIAGGRKSELHRDRRMTCAWRARKESLFTVP